MAKQIHTILVRLQNEPATITDEDLRVIREVDDLFMAGVQRVTATLAVITSEATRLLEAGL